MTDILGAIANMVGMGQRQAEAPRIGDRVEPPATGARLLPDLPSARTMERRISRMPVAPFEITPQETEEARRRSHPADPTSRVAERRYPRGLDMPMGPTGLSTGVDRAHEPRVARLIDASNSAIRESAWQARHMPVYPNAGRATPSHPMGPGGVTSLSPVEAASRATNVSAPFMQALIGHESGGRADAKNPESTATGHGQFIEATWLRLMREHGPEYGLPPDMSREDVLRLRNSPAWSALMVGIYTNENAAVLERALPGRALKPADLYLAHFLGADVAAAMLRAQASGRGNVRAGAVVSRAALNANRNVFFADGRPRTIDEVIALQGRNFRHLERESVRRSGRR